MEKVERAASDNFLRATHNKQPENDGTRREEGRRRQGGDKRRGDTRGGTDGKEITSAEEEEEEEKDRERGEWRNRGKKRGREDEVKGRRIKWKTGKCGKRRRKRERGMKVEQTMI